MVFQFSENHALRLRRAPARLVPGLKLCLTQRKTQNPRSSLFFPPSTSGMAAKLSLSDLILEMYNVNGLKFGSFTMRTGEVTPVYIDMRVIWSYPKIVVSMQWIRVS